MGGPYPALPKPNRPKPLRRSTTIAMRVLVVSTYPPKHCGIASYAAQQVEALRREGHEVLIMSVDGEGAVDYRLRLTDPSGAENAITIFAGFDRVILHYAPGIIAPDRDTREVFHGALHRACKSLPATRFEVLIHEMEYPGGWRRRRRQAQLWRSVTTLLFHTPHERDQFARRYPSVPRDRLQLVEHGRTMRKFYHDSRADARAELGIDPDQIMFVSCGFIQESKGYDRVVSIFADATNLPPTAHYHVVGSARRPESIPYRDQLAEAAGRVPKVTLHDEYIDDESFDRWIVAADYIVAPYRTIWSSSLLARAALHDRPVIATDVGGLRDQARAGDTIVADDRELAQAIETLANKHRATAPDSYT